VTRFIDCTLGRGGHASAIGPLLGAGGTLRGASTSIRATSSLRRSALKDPAVSRARLFHANFAEINDVWDEIGKAAGQRDPRGPRAQHHQLFDERYGLSFAQAIATGMRIDPRIDRNRRRFSSINWRTRDLANVLYRTGAGALLRGESRERLSASPAHFADS